MTHSIDRELAFTSKWLKAWIGRIWRRDSDPWSSDTSTALRRNKPSLSECVSAEERTPITCPLALLLLKGKKGKRATSFNALAIFSPPCTPTVKKQTQRLCSCTTATAALLAQPPKPFVFVTPPDPFPPLLL